MSKGGRRTDAPSGRRTQQVESPVPFWRCAAATVRDACEGLTDDLLAAGFHLPSIYLLVDQRLRCLAAHGYFQVVNGFSPGAGVIGGVVASGNPVVS